MLLLALLWSRLEKLKTFPFLFHRISSGRAADGLWRGLVLEHILAFDHRIGEEGKKMAKEVHFGAVAQGREALLSLICVSKRRDTNLVKAET